MIIIIIIINNEIAFFGDNQGNQNSSLRRSDPVIHHQPKFHATCKPLDRILTAFILCR